MPFENTKKALAEFEAGEEARDKLLFDAETNADVEAWQKVEHEALLKVRAAFAEDTKQINSRETVMSCTDIGFMKKCANR